jgi:hypothetical protein
MLPRLVQIAFMACMAAMMAHSTVLTDKEDIYSSIYKEYIHVTRYDMNTGNKNNAM